MRIVTKGFLNLTVLSFCFWTFSNGSLAAPTINATKLTSDPQSGETQILISGSGFTDKKHSLPLYFFDFEDNKVTQNPKYSYVSTLVTTNGLLTSETTPTGSGNSMRWRIQQDYRALPIPEIDFSSDRLYVYFHRRYNFDIGDSSTWGANGFNLKTNRLWANTKNNIYIGYQGKEGNGSGRIYPEYTADGGAVWTGSRLPQVANKWLQEEIIYETGDIGIKNGRFDLIRNGTSAHDQLFRMRTSSYPEAYDQLVFDQITDQTPADKYLYIYFDNIYIDDSFHRVYVSDAPVYSDAKLRLIQIPTEWNDTSITVIFNPGSYSPSNLYLYVVDGNGNANAYGVEICQDDCPSPPSPPDSVDLQ